MVQQGSLGAGHTALKAATSLRGVISQVPMAAFIQAQPAIAVGHMGPLGHGLSDNIVHTLDLSGCASTAIDPRPAALLSNALAMNHLQTQHDHQRLVAIALREH